MITPDDVVLALSNSGKATNYWPFCPIVKRSGTKLITMTGNMDSEMAKTCRRTFACVHQARSLSAQPRTDREHHCRLGSWRRVGGGVAENPWF